MPPEPRELDDKERDLLDFERDWQAHDGCKRAAIRQRFAFSSTRYYQLLARLVDDPAALAYDPLTVRRVRRRRGDLARKRATAAATRPQR